MEEPTTYHFEIGASRILNKPTRLETLGLKALSSVPSSVLHLWNLYTQQGTSLKSHMKRKLVKWGFLEKRPRGRIREDISDEERQRRRRERTRNCMRKLREKRRMIKIHRGECSKFIVAQ
jgi:hypothetical protein